MTDSKMDRKQPTLYIIAGCNGAGKTTASFTVLPEILHCKEFVNADEIAKGLSPFNPAEMAIKAGKIMICRINELLLRHSTFAIETTLSTRSYAGFIKRAREAGYTVVLIFFWLPSPKIAKERVARRVVEGGHGIPEHVIVRRYYLGIKNLFDIYIPIVDSWAIYENVSKATPIASDYCTDQPVKHEYIKCQTQTRDN